MSDPDLPVIETTGGDRPPNTIAERGTVALALLALAGGMLIALGNLFGGQDGPTTASTGPVAHATPRPSPRATPMPTPREIVLIAGTPPSAAPSEAQPYPFSGWIRVLADQPILSASDGHGIETGVLHAGEIGYAEDDLENPGWLHVLAPTPGGYVLVADGATEQVERIVPQPYVASGDVWAVAAGSNGFVAIGYSADSSNGGASSFTAFSADGAAWEATDLPANISAVAWGPARWLAVGSVDDPGSPGVWVFRSADGLHWSSLGAASGLEYASQLVGSESGYVIETSGRSSESTSLWFSGDGVTWVESADPGVGGGGFRFGGERHLAGIGSGFYAWTDEAQQAFSADGQTWTTVEDGPAGVNLKLTMLGDRVIAAVTGPVDGGVRFRTGAIDGPRLAWDTDLEVSTGVSSAVVSGVGVAALVSDGRRATALLWERSTDTPLAWTSSDGLQWRPRPLPPGAFGGTPRLAAGGPAGVVVVGARPTLRGSNPIFWREVGRNDWEPEPAPLFDVVPDPSDDACDPPPRDLLDFLILDRAVAVVCLGDAPLTFRAYSASCNGCYPEDPGGYDPAWLAYPTANQLFVSPIATDVAGYQQVITSPTLAIDPAWTGHWIDLTGHFDDAAATSCHWTPSLSEEAWYSGQYWVVSGCRQQFVVTAVRVVDGP